MSSKSDCWEWKAGCWFVTCPVNSACELSELNEDDSFCSERWCITSWSCPKVWLLWLRSMDGRLLDLGCSCKSTPSKIHLWVGIQRNISGLNATHQIISLLTDTNLRQILWLPTNRFQDHSKKMRMRWWITSKMMTFAGWKKYLPLSDDQQHLTLLVEANYPLLLAVEWEQKHSAFANASHPQDLHNQH